MALRIEAEVSEVRTMFGKRRGYTAKLGELSADGKTRKEAEANLAALIVRLASERCEPVVRLDQDGHAWIAYRSSAGDWLYGHARTFDGGAVGETRIGGMTVRGMEATRRQTVEDMNRHFESNNPPAVEAAS